MISMTTEVVDKLRKKKLRQTYLALSFLSGAIELGSVVLMIAISGDLIAILVAGLSYQVGNLLSSTLRLSKKMVLVLLFTALFFIVAYYFYEDLFFFYVAVGSTSWGMQKMRRFTKASISEIPVSTFTKRLVRIGGFLMAGFVTTEILIVIVGLVLLITINLALAINGDWKYIPPILKPSRSPLSDIMTIHQSHYFSYAYLIPIVLIKASTIPTIFVGAFFIIGWLSYIYSEQLLGKYKLIHVFMMGHTLVATSLFFMWMFSDSFVGILLFWFLSGFGGGTVFCIKRLNKKDYAHKKVELDFWEDLGHVLGVIIVILIGWVLDLQNEADAFLASAMIAIITAGMMLSYYSTIVYNKGKS